MIDALLLAVLDTVRAAGFGWDNANCDIMADGQPGPMMGDWFLAIHQQVESGTMKNALNTYTDFAMTLTYRVGKVPFDRIGSQVITSKLARTMAAEVGFNARAHQLATFLHQNWWVIQAANDWLLKLYPQAYIVHGFAEAFEYGSMELPIPVGGEWFGSDPEAPQVGIKAEIRFKDARRFQPIAEYV